MFDNIHKDIKYFFLFLRNFIWRTGKNTERLSTLFFLHSQIWKDFYGNMGRAEVIIWEKFNW